MPVRYTIHPDLKLVSVCCEGLVTDAECFDFRSQVFADPAYPAAHLRLYDARQVTGIRFSTLSIWKLAYEAMLNRESRRVFITPEQSSAQVESTFQLLRMIQGKSTFVTRDVATAWDWLDLPLDRRDPIIGALCAARRG